MLASCERHHSSAFISHGSRNKQLTTTPAIRTYTSLHHMGTTHASGHLQYRRAAQLAHDKTVNGEEDRQMRTDLHQFRSVNQFARGNIGEIISPITLPSRSMSGPPEFPELIAASVWMKSVESLVVSADPESSTESGHASVASKNNA